MPCMAHSEEALERYAMGLSDEAETDAIEEHLLVCPACCESIAFLDAMIDASRERRGQKQVLSLRARS